MSPSPSPTSTTIWSWRFRSEFGPWLRELRQTHRMTLRDASGRMWISFTRLHKLETNGRVRAPSLELLGRVAELYGLGLEDVLLRAGYRMEVPEDLRDAVRCDDAFAAVVLHPDLRPAAMDERWLEAFSRIQKAQWVEFARRLDQLARRGGPTVDAILEHAAGANDVGAPGARARRAS